MKSEHLHKYTGNLEFYYETGMEQMATIFHDDRGLHNGPKYDNPSETMTYKSIAWSIWFGQKFAIYNIKVFNKNGTIAYEGPLVQDRAKLKRSKYSVSFLPVTLDKRTWFRFCKEELRAELYTNDLPHAIMEEYGIKIGVGQVYKDKLTNKRALIIGHTLNAEAKTFEYLVALLSPLPDNSIPATYVQRKSEDLTVFSLSDVTESGL